MQRDSTVPRGRMFDFQLLRYDLFAHRMFSELITIQLLSSSSRCHRFSIHTLHADFIFLLSQKYYFLCYVTFNDVIFHDSLQFPREKQS